ncbi:PREDICTED: poly(U)-specific endoribonuclease homolog [Polistes canadensis]|uniref:poly(U)-specific endoribonuclease homolog n=1 Tax=Polistes canadensis TaxID=91411 RepID=UPI000718F743|nr:PREDICTED: poly(U)-specific endoribonuclease homolog [Polistes canadensis]
MIIRKTLIILIATFLIFATGEARKTGGGGRKNSGGWGWGSRSSRTTSKPPHSRPQNTEHGSTPNKIGWNVPDSNRQASSNTASKPSAPALDQNIASKTSATSLQSGYNPSGGYPRQSQPIGSQQSAHNPYNNAGYNPSAGQGYNPSVGGYNPSVGGYNPSVGGYNHGYPGQGQSYSSPHMGQPYNPMGSGYNPAHGQPFNPSYGQSYSPSFGQAPQQTILLPSSQPYKPGIGQIAKEAFVFAGVSAGVNAAVSRILPGGIYGHSGGGGGSSGNAGTPVSSHTQITYNNYYNNATPDANVGAAQPAAAQPAAVQPAAAQPAASPSVPNGAAVLPEEPPTVKPLQNTETNANSNASPGADKSNTQNSPGSSNNPNPLGFVTSDEDIKKLSEELFNKDTNNAFKYITIKLQGQKKDDSVTDDASDPLLDVKPEAYEIPTIKSVIDLYDDYELDVKVKENLTPERRKKESEFLDKLLETDVMQNAMKFLANKGYIPDDPYEFKDTLKRIWFSQFKRIDGDASSSGFETVFLAEQFDSDIIGLHNWIYYAMKEAEKKIDYLGYIKELTFGDKAAVLKIRSKLNGFVQPVTSIFVGTSPELEMALYTVCFFARPNTACPVSFSGTNFIIIANRVNYFGKDILVAAFPEI